MGGDFAPAAAVGAAAVISRETSIKTLLVGHPERIQEELGRHEHHADRIGVLPAMEVVGMAEKPREALSKKKDASITVACKAVASGEADAVVSAGSTGALVI